MNQAVTGPVASLKANLAARSMSFPDSPAGAHATAMRPEFVVRTFRAYLVIAGLTFTIILLLGAPVFLEKTPSGTGWLLVLVTLVYVPIQSRLYIWCGRYARGRPLEEKFHRTVFSVLLRDSLFLCLLVWSAGTWTAFVSMFVLVPILMGILLLDRYRIRLLAIADAVLLTGIILLETFEIIPHVEWSLEFVNLQTSRWHALPVIASYVCCIFVVYSVGLAVLEELARKRDELEVAASRDSLTGLYNRRVFELSAMRELERAARTGTAVTFVLVDIDFFKQVNDSRGHAAGDLVLKTVGGVFDRSLRRGMDFAFRFGGDEFVLLLTDTGGDGARTILLRILDQVRDTRFVDGAGTFSVTLSLGAFSVWAAANPADLDYCLERADQCLYRAKRSGRDQLVIEEERRHHPVEADKATGI